MIVFISNLEDLRQLAVAKTIRFRHANAWYGITWDPGRGEWWMIHENSEYNDWYKDEDLPQLVFDAITEKP